MLSGFRDGCFNALVTTDISSCNLDVHNVDLVCLSSFIRYNLVSHCIPIRILCFMIG
ncbi:putative RNA helicase [Helianthus anomalus]